jgi:signal transduction histidine kinase
LSYIQSLERLFTLEDWGIHLTLRRTTVHRLLRIAIALTGLLGPSVCSAAETLSRSILIIDQLEPGTPFFVGFLDAFRSTVNARSVVPVSYYPEHLDFGRYSGPEYEELLRNYFRGKYPKGSVGVIVVNGSGALEYALHLRNELWSDVPVVFAGVDQNTSALTNLSSNVTGTTMRTTLRDAMTAARVLVPGLERVALVGDPLERQPPRRHLTEELPLIATEVELIDLTGMPMAELRRRVAALPERTAIIYTGIYVDAAGVAHNPREAVASVAEVANRPMVIDRENLLGSGGTGGFLIGPAPIGRDAARMVLRVLDGEMASNIPITAGDFTRPVFDWRQLQRFGISEAQLPPGSEIRFRQLSIWDQYRVQIITSLTLLLIQTVIIGWLLLERRGRHFAELQSRGRQKEVIHLDRVAAVGAMSASIAHELNQPLGAILANVETAEMLLAANPIDRDQFGEILADIRQSDQRAGEIIAHMRGLLKRRTIFELQEFDLNDALRKALHTLEPEARKRGVLLRAYLTQGALPVRADPVHLEQVILNLATNAMDAMQDCAPNSRKMAVRTASVGESEVEVSVSDCGLGIPNDKLKGVFETFYTTKEKGTGLGLSIVRTIVEASGGKVWAENCPGGGGAVFRFTLPLIEAHAA